MLSLERHSSRFLLDESEDEAVGPVDFRSLSVREFGTIYEGATRVRALCCH